MYFLPCVKHIKTNKSLINGLLLFFVQNQFSINIHVAFLHCYQLVLSDCGLVKYFWALQQILCPPTVQKHLHYRMTGNSKSLLVCVTALCMCVSCDLLDHFTVQIMCNYLKKPITIKNISASKIVSVSLTSVYISRLNKYHDIMAANMFVQCTCVSREQTIIIYDRK